MCVGMNRQRGVGILVLILVLLAGAGSATFWMRVSTVQPSAEITLMNSTRQDLLAARQALLAYATGYAQLYGEAGAGPGHFPCPDSDIRKPIDSTGTSVLIDGPNPPCGRGLSASGWLPRQVTVDAHRYVIQAQQFRNYRYTVATGYVNNPINRTVNSQSGTGLSVEGRHDIVAMISTDGAVNSKGIRVFVYRKQLIDTVQRAVTGWLLETLQRVYLERCRDTSVDESMECRFTPDTPTRNNPLQREQYLILQGQDLLFVLTDPMDNTIGRTPAQRHWFVRNRWYEEFELRIHPDCLVEQSGQSGRCHFIIGSGVQTDSESVEDARSDQAAFAQVQDAITSPGMTGNNRASHRIQRIDWQPENPGGGE